MDKREFADRYITNAIANHHLGETLFKAMCARQIQFWRKRTREENGQELPTPRNAIKLRAKRVASTDLQLMCVAYHFAGRTATECVALQRAAVKKAVEHAETYTP